MGYFQAHSMNARSDTLMHAMQPPSRTGMPEDADLTDAMVFLNRIKEEYTDALPVYDSFLETMRDFKFGKIDADEVCKAVRILFKDKPFLIHLFDEYLPQYLRYSDSRSYDQAKFPPYRSGPFLGAAQMPMGRPVISQQMPRSAPAHISPGYGSRGMRPSIPYHLNPQKPQPTEMETPKHRLAEDFIHLVKKRYLNDPTVYKQFVELLQRSKNGFSKLLTEVSALFSDAPDLIELFERNFRPVSSSEAQDASADPLKAIKDSLAEKNVLEDFLKILNFYNQNYISAEDLIFMTAPIIGDDENLKAFKSFIRYSEPHSESMSTETKDYERIGSYKIFPYPIIPESSVCDVINNICVSVSTHESEEDTYVFRNKNSSEELLVRISDERSESDLLLGRLRYLIGQLESIYSDLQDRMLELDDIRMSAALVKETLKQIYEGKSGEVLEAILSNPKKAIPVVLKRIYAVYRENLLKHREHRKVWRDLVTEHYYKAYDTRGVMFKSSERKFLTLRHIHSEGSTPFSTMLSDLELIRLIKNLFSYFVGGAPSVAQRKVSLERQTEYFEGVVNRLVEEDGYNITTDFDYYALCLYICTVYSRFHELKGLPATPLTSSKTAAKLGLQDDFCILDRYAMVVAASESLARREIDAEQYEERIRFLTESTGYKLYNLRRILSKMEKLVLQLLLRETDEIGPLFDGEYVISKKEGIVVLCALDDNVD